MLLEIAVGSERTEVDLVDGTFLVGGAATDEVQLPGLPHSMLTLLLEGSKVTVTSKLSLTIGKARFPAHVPRLLVPGEVMQLPRNVTLAQRWRREEKQARKQMMTARVLKDLVSEAYAPDLTRAASLVCLTGSDAGRRWPLGLSEMLIGRADDVPIRVRDISVSRRHATLQREGEAYLLTAITGTNGVFVNGKRVLTATALKPGDVLELGQTALRFEGPPPKHSEPSLRDAAEQALATPPEPEAFYDDEPTEAVPPPKWELLAIIGGALVALTGVAVAASLL